MKMITTFGFAEEAAAAVGVAAKQDNRSVHWEIITLEKSAHKKLGRCAPENAKDKGYCKCQARASLAATAHVWA